MTYKLFYSPDYTLSGHAFETTRKAAWIAASLKEKPIRGVLLHEPAPLVKDTLKCIHDTAYIDAVRTGRPRVLAESQGFTWDENLWRMVCASNAGAVSAALAALRDGVSGSLSSGLHHARWERGAGYCTFNGLALAAYEAINVGAQRILIIDADAHCGGGTAEITKHFGQTVHHLDISTDDYDRYEPRSPHTLDVIQDARMYLHCLSHRLKELCGSFDLCIYNAGMDSFEGCPDGGLAGMTTDVLRRREELVFSWCLKHNLPVSFVMAGGYLGPNMDQTTLVDLHRLTVEAAVQD